MASSRIEELARYFTEAPGILAVYIGGSHGRGHYDQYSDIELVLLWQKLPDLFWRQKMAGNLKALTPWGFSEPCVADNLILPDVSLDLIHCTAKQLESEVMGYYVKPTLAFQPVILCLRNTTPLKDTDGVFSGIQNLASQEISWEQWQNLLDLTLIETCRRGFLLHQIRQDWPAFYTQLGIWQTNYLKTSCIINQKLWPGIKFTQKLIKELGLEVDFAAMAFTNNLAQETVNLCQSLWDKAEAAGFKVDKEALQTRLDLGRLAILETHYLLSVPGMRESIREGLDTDLTKCGRKIGW